MNSGITKNLDDLYDFYKINVITCPMPGPIYTLNCERIKFKNAFYRRNTANILKNNKQFNALHTHKPSI